MYNICVSYTLRSNYGTQQFPRCGTAVFRSAEVVRGQPRLKCGQQQSCSSCLYTSIPVVACTPCVSGRDTTTAPLWETNTCSSSHCRGGNAVRFVPLVHTYPVPSSLHITYTGSLYHTEYSSFHVSTWRYIMKKLTGYQSPTFWQRRRKPSAAQQGPHHTRKRRVNL